MNKKDLKISIILFIIGIFFMIESLRMPRLGKYFYSSPGFFPLIVSICIVILSILLFIKSSKIKGAFVFVTKKPDLSNSEFVRGSQIIILLAVYIFVLLGRINYQISTALFLMISISIFHSKRNYFKISMISVISSGVLYYLFGRVFMIPLP